MSENANKENTDIERVVHEVRRTTMVPKVQSDRFVFEKHDEEWHAHFAAATKYSLTQMKEIVEIMENLSEEGHLKLKG